jgi:hypothetical protein
MRKSNKRCPPIAFASFTEGCVTHSLNDVALSIGDGVDGAEVVVVEIAGFVRDYFGKVYEQIKQNTNTEHKHFIYLDKQLIAIHIKTDTVMDLLPFLVMLPLAS